MRAFALGVAVAVIGVCASPAWGAFPGRDGDLVVSTGAGLELVAPGTGAGRSICTSVVLCGHPAQPSFSPNGRAIAFVDGTSHRPVVVAADGSCLWCLLGARLTSLTGSEPAFTPDGQGVTVAQNGLWSVSLTGGHARRLLKAPVDSAVWSSRLLVALVRGGWIWVERPGHGKLRRLARGRSPSLSPDGARLALARDGYVWIVRVTDGTEHRLVRGGGPAWSPNGRQIAYIAAGDAVEVIAVRGGRPRHVGSVRGTALDWQPKPTSAKRACRPPRGSTVLASNRDALVFSQDRVLHGCLKSLGLTRVLQNGATGYAADVDALIGVRLAGRFAAIATEVGKPPDLSDVATLYDLSTGKSTNLAGVVVPGPGVENGLDSLALDSSGFAAWRETTSPTARPLSDMSCTSASLCVAGDVAGNILSSTNPTGGPTAWSSAAVSPQQSIQSVSCPSISLCVAVGFIGNVLTSTDPTGGASAWTKTTIDQGSFFDTVSCPAVSLCVAGGGSISIDGGATILTSTNPTGGASSWSSAPVASGNEIVNAMSCPSDSLCVATTNKGDVLTSTNPTGGASAWTKTTINQARFLSAVSCPSVSLCVATSDTPSLFISTNLTGGTNAWTKIDQGSFFDTVSCPAVSLCVAAGGGNVLTSTDPTGGASAWTNTAIEQGNDVYAVSCPSIFLCAAADQSGNILTSTDPTGGANAWTSATVDIPGCAPPSNPCISEKLYARDDQVTRILDAAAPGKGNSIRNVALGSDSLILTWAHDGAQRQLQLG